MPPLEDSHLEPDRQTRKAGCILGSIALVLVLGTLGFLLIYDLSPPEDRDMMPHWTAKEAEVNPLEVFGKKLSSGRRLFIPPALLRDRPLNTDALREKARSCLKENQATLEDLDTLLATDPKLWRWTRLGDAPAQGQSAPGRHEVPSLQHVIQSADLLRLRSRLYVAEGDPMKGATDLLTLLRFARGLEGAECKSVQYLMLNSLGAPVLVQFERQMAAQESLSLTPAELRQLASQFLTLEPSRSSLQFVLRAEYEETKAMILDLKKNGTITREMISDHLPPFPVAQLRPNMTAASHLLYLRPIVQGLEKDWPDACAAVQTAPKPEPPPVRDYKGVGGYLARFNPNATGLHLLRHYLPVAGVMVERQAAHTTALRAAAVQLALRAHERELQHLPQRIEELTPSYLPATPTVPATGQPMQWDPATRTLRLAPPDTPDSTSPYWWTGDPPSPTSPNPR